MVPYSKANLADLPALVFIHGNKDPKSPISKLPREIVGLIIKTFDSTEPLMPQPERSLTERIKDRIFVKEYRFSDDSSYVPIEVLSFRYCTLF